MIDCSRCTMVSGSHFCSSDVVLIDASTPDDFAKMGPDRIVATARREGIRFLVIVKSNSIAREATLKLKDVGTNSEKEGEI